MAILNLKPLLSKQMFTNLFLRRKNHNNIVFGTPSYDVDYLLDPTNTTAIEFNTKNRKGIGDIKLILELNDKLKQEQATNGETSLLKTQLQQELRKIPNKTHPDIINYGNDPKIVGYFNEKPKLPDKIYEFSDICRKLNLLRMDNLGNFNGHKSYYLLADLAELEQALIKFAASNLIKNGFELITVPDILPAQVIESCGMNTQGERNQVYKLDSSNETLCLSGTSEMALAGYFSGSEIDSKKLPLKLTAVSRCFRAETSGLQEEKGIYRVHQFTKVEMFSVCRPEQSEAILNEFRDFEVDLFTKLGIHFKLLDMPPFELGASAYRKYDIEAWMPGRKYWGEISSCSDCTDYQARRLNIRFKKGSVLKFAHTVNGTACAIPRMLIALIENYQNSNGTITIPKVLKKYMGNKEKIVKTKMPETKLVKRIPQEGIC